MNVFLDAEFTDIVKESALISLGMVADRGEEFYIEVPYPGAQCTPFVHESLPPLLGRDPNAFCLLEEVWMQMMTWLKMIRRDINKLLRYDFYKRTGLPEHHALYDARANQYAYRPRNPGGKQWKRKPCLGPSH
jgi:hypothetical protein